MEPQCPEANGRKIEIGDMNGIRPLITGLHYNVLTIDGDFMGRAYPRLYMLTPYREYIACGETVIVQRTC